MSRESRAEPSPYLATVPDYEICDGNMRISSGDFQLVMPLRIFEQGMARSARVIAKYRAGTAKVVPIRRGKG
jgi:predicted SpoU family rRNA methylase